MAPRIIARISCSVISIDIHVVDDADDGSIDWSGLLAERFSSSSTFEHDQHFLVDAGTDAVDRQQRRPARGIVDVERLHQQQLGTFELPMFLSRDNGPDDAGYLHRKSRMRIEIANC